MESERQAKSDHIGPAGQGRGKTGDIGLKDHTCSQVRGVCHGCPSLSAGVSKFYPLPLGLCKMHVTVTGTCLLRDLSGELPQQ